MKNPEKPSDDSEKNAKNKFLDMVTRHIGNFIRDEEPDALRRHVNAFNQERRATAIADMQTSPSAIPKETGDEPLVPETETDNDLLEVMWMRDRDISGEDLDRIIRNSRQR